VSARWAAVALTAAGAVVGVVAAVAVAPGYDATATVVVRANDAPAALPTVAGLATSDVVVQNVAAALDLSEARVRANLHASTVTHSALVRIRYHDRDAVRARRVDQQATAVLQAIAGPRLGNGVRVDVVDPAHATSSARPYARDAGLGALVGAAAGGILLLAARLRRRAALPKRRADPHDLLGRVRAALADREGEFPEERLLEWYALLGVLSAEADGGPLSPALERVARERFAPLLAPPKP
jgi:hypothetical protein